MIVIVGGGNLGPVASLAITALFLLVPSIIETLTNRERPDATVLPAYFVFLFLQVLVPIASLGLITALLINERFRRFLRLGTLDDENHDQGTHARPRTPRSTTAAAAGIRKLPLIKYRTRRDLEALSLKELVAYRNEVRDKGYKAITTSSGKKTSEVLQSRAEVIQEIVGPAGDRDGEDEDVCSICFGAYESNDILRILPKCGHVFHAECIDRWILTNPLCPLCKTSWR
jgi:hypothetical protein